jgi:hypothetical protein
MNDKHYKEKFSAYINHELPKEERQEIAEHILVCESCREEHDQVKLGAGLAGMLRQADAPQGTWAGIEAAIVAKKHPSGSIFSLKVAALGFASVVAIFGLIAFIYLVLQPNAQPVADAGPSEISQPPVNGPGPFVPVAVPTNTNSVVPVNETPLVAGTGSNTVHPVTPDGTSVTPSVPMPARVAAPPATWNFETLAGMPKVGGASESGKLAVGDFLETDGASKARIEVADIGNVEIEPNSRVRLVNTSKKQHRLSLERGTLQAQILAPPRLFIVDTPSAVAVDLGCAYKLEVDKAGNTKLHVTSGYVALERAGRESIVPAGAMCLTRRGQGIGTPFFETASPALETALFKFDFERGGAASLARIMTESRAEDTLTLWHLLPRVSQADRERLFEVLSSYVAPPEGVTREGVLKLNKKMLEDWRIEMENIWFS